MSVLTLFQEMLVTGIWMTWDDLVIDLGKVCSLEWPRGRIHPMVLGEKSEDNALLSSSLRARNNDELPRDEAWLEQSITYWKMYTLGGLC